MLLFLADELTEFIIQWLRKKLRVPLLSKISPDPSFSKRGNFIVGHTPPLAEGD
jgi:hypothetical protein